MARLWIDGFEYGTGVATLIGYEGSAGASTAGPYTGAYALSSFGLSSYYLQKVLSPAISEAYVKFHYRPGTVAAAGAVAAIYKGATCLFWIRQNNRDLELYSGTGTGTSLGTAANALSAEPTDFNLLEFRFKLDGADGVAQLRVNEILLIDFGPGDTAPDANTDFDRVRMGAGGGANITTGARYDDFIIDDATWPGNKRVYKIQPTGSGNSTQWDPYPTGAGTNWSRVDEISYSDADFVSTNVADETDLYDCSDLPETATGAKGLLVVARVVEEGAATPQSVQIAIRTNGADYFGDSEAPPSGTPTFIHKFWPTNPATAGDDFSVAEINAVEIGIKSLA